MTYKQIKKMIYKDYKMCLKYVIKSQKLIEKGLKCAEFVESRLEKHSIPVVRVLTGYEKGSVEFIIDFDEKSFEKRYELLRKIFKKSKRVYVTEDYGLSVVIYFGRVWR